MKSNGTPQSLVYVDDDILSGSVQAVNKETDALVVASKEIGLEVNADKTRYMAVSGDQNAGRRHSMKTDNSFFEKVGQFRYLGTTLTNQNCIQEEIKSNLKSGNARCHSVQNLLCSSLLSRNLNINP